MSINGNDIYIKNKIIYCTVNSLLIALLLCRSFSVTGLMTSIVFTAIIYAYIVIKNDVNVPASSYVSFLLVADVFMIFGIFYENFKAYHVSSYMPPVSGVVYIVLFLLGIGIYLVGLLAEKMLWFSFVGGEVIGLTIIFNNWAMGDILHPTFVEGGLILFLIYMAFFALWYFFAQTDLMISYNRRISTMLMGLLLLAGVLFLFIYGLDCIGVNRGSFSMYIENIMSGTLIWWKLLIIEIVLLVLSAVMYDYDKNRIGTDSYVYLSLAVALIMLKMTYHFHSTVAIIIFLLFLGGLLFGYVNEIRRKGTLRLPNELYAAVLFGCFLLTSVLLQKELYWNIVMTSIIGIFFYNIRKPADIDNRRRKNLYWSLILFLAAAEVWAYKLSTMTVFSGGKFTVYGLEELLHYTMVLLIVLTVSVSLMMILNAQKPRYSLISDKCRVLICSLASLLYVFALKG